LGCGDGDGSGRPVIQLSAFKMARCLLQPSLSWINWITSPLLPQAKQ